LLTRADIGGGDARITWSAALGAEYRFANWGGLVVTYKGSASTPGKTRRPRRSPRHSP
jgi:hypothetical protein